MIKSTNRISRRLVLSSGAVVMGLPFLDAMLRPGQSHAQANQVAQRFVSFYTPGGTLLENWRPTGTETAWEFKPMLAPLTPFKAKINMIDALDMSVAIDDGVGVGHHHCRGTAGVLTGHALNGQFADGPSIDQLIADELSKTHPSPFKSLEFATGWGTGIGNNAAHSSNQINMAGNDMPLTPATDPLSTFNRIFGDLKKPAAGPMPGTDQVSLSLRVLDSVARQYTAAAAQVGYADRMKLEQHLALVSEARKKAEEVGNSTCGAPVVDQNPASYKVADATREEILAGGGKPDAQSDKNVKSGELVPKIGDVMTDMLVAALGCGLTNVASMQWGDSEAKFLLNFLKDSDGMPFKDHHHGYQHDRGFQAGSLEIIYNFYAQKLASLLGKLDAIQEANGMTLLDNAAVLAISELQKPDTHSRNDMPFLLAGKAGGKLTSGRYMMIPGPRQPHNHLLLAICQLYGYQGTVVGHADYSKGVLAGLA
ncbi:MAG: hypothetical protein RJA70_775 [Pseudomonadota bacterium]|jgi:uncharacterized protein YlxP (DUF503 family)